MTPAAWPTLAPMSRRPSLPATLTVATLLVAGCGGSQNAGSAARPDCGPTGAPTLRQELGQRLLVGVPGPTPDAPLLRAIRHGEVGGSVLYAYNTVSPPQLRALARQLHAAARACGRPHFLVVVDQEGGQVRRLRWAPPRRSPPAIGRAGDGAARTEGRATGRALRAAGVDVDLAPVTDVPRTRRAVIAREGRQLGFDASTVGARAGAFADGLRAGGVRGALKHFPGLGAALHDTDVHPQVLPASRSTRTGALHAFVRALAGGGSPLVMLAWARYPSLDARHLAGASPAIVGLLRRRLGFGGVIVTDALVTRSVRAVTTPERMAVASARAGADLLDTGENTPGWRPTLAALERAARAGTLRRADLARSYARVVALKRALR